MKLWYDQTIEKGLDFKHIYEFGILSSNEKHVRVVYLLKRKIIFK